MNNGGLQNSYMHQGNIAGQTPRHATTGICRTMRDSTTWELAPGTMPGVVTVSDKTEGGKEIYFLYPDEFVVKHYFMDNFTNHLLEAQTQVHSSVMFP